MPCTHICKVPSKFKPVTHVIFDLDGTILDTERIYSNAMAEVVAKYGKKFTDETRQKVAGTSEWDAAWIIISQVRLPLTRDEFIQKYRQPTNAKLAKCDIMPGAEALIKHFHSKNIPIAVATSSTQESFNIKTQKHRELFRLFHHIVCGGSDPEVKEGKPSPDIFLACASRFEEKPEPSQCLVIEDSPNGVNAALSAGMQVVMIPADYVPYEVWKNATQRLDALHFLKPEFFGLPSLYSPDDFEKFLASTRPSVAN